MFVFTYKILQPLTLLPFSYAAHRYSYARVNSTVNLREMSLVDNIVAGGSVVVAISSHLETYQVRRY